MFKRLVGSRTKTMTVDSTHSKFDGQTGTGVKNPMCDLPIQINHLTVQIDNVQLAPRLGPVQGTVGGMELCNTMGFLVIVCPQKGVRVSRGELRDVGWVVRRYPNAQLVATHYQTPIQGLPYPEKELIKRGQRS